MRKVKSILFGLFLGAAVADAQEVLFPQVSGWKLAVETRVYDANDLWDIIDGAADLYVEYGFVDLHTARYTTAEGRDVKAELYRHRDSENAFGIYAAERNPENHFLAIGTQGYRETSILNFVDGEFYLRLSSHQSDEASGNALLQIARALEQQLHRSASLPAVLSLFPASGKQENTEQYVAQNFLGYSFLRSVYTASYGDGVKAFIIARHSSSAADSLLAACVSTVPPANSTRRADGSFLLQDPNNGPIALGREGAYVFGILNCTDAARSDTLFARLKQSCAHP
ncbi:MAG TPA: DUF6599 family protein [Bacteroidota bacterium]|nr:DUF6599 family protein [Bacteroidota bacterium]